jgi:hypothetical protein
MKPTIDHSPEIQPKKHWYYIAWVAVFGVVIIGGLAESDIAGGKYNLYLYSACGFSLLLACYSIIKHKFGGLVDLILLLPGGGGGGLDD